MRLTWFGLYCGLLLSISAFSIDMLLPAFLDVSEGLNVPVKLVQMTVPVYMVALGLAHPVFGVMTDRYGRKPAIFAGLFLYIIGCLFTVFAADIDQILVGRFIQGFGAASAAVVCRAMIRDRFSGVKLAQNMAIASMFFALGPMLAPLIGYLLNTFIGWRSVFVFLLLFGVFLVLATATQPETLLREKRNSARLGSIWRDVKTIFSIRQSRYFIVLSGFCTGTILSFLSQAPVIYEHNLGAPNGQFAIMFALSAIGIIVGQIANHRLISAVGAVRAAVTASWVIVVAALAILVGAVTNTITVITFTALMFMFNSCYLIVYSNFVSMALEPNGDRAGMATAIFGLVSYLVGSALAALIAFVSGGSMQIWAGCFLFLTILISLGVTSWVYTGRRIVASQ